MALTPSKNVPLIMCYKWKKKYSFVNKSLYFVFLFSCLLYLFPCIYKNIIDSNVFIYTSSTPWNSPWSNSFTSDPRISPSIFEILHGYLHISIHLQIYIKFSMDISTCPFLHGYLDISMSPGYLHACIHGHLQVFMKLSMGISLSSLNSFTVSLYPMLYP